MIMNSTLYLAVRTDAAGRKAVHIALGDYMRYPGPALNLDTRRTEQGLDVLTTDAINLRELDGFIDELITRLEEIRQQARGVFPPT